VSTFVGLMMSLHCVFWRICEFANELDAMKLEGWTVSYGKYEECQGLVLHGVLIIKAFIGQVGWVRPLAVLVSRLAEKKNGHGTKSKSIATGVGVKCYIEFGLEGVVT
jgi:hypothetical protein